MDNWHLGAAYMRHRQREALRERDQIRWVHLAKAGSGREAPERLSALIVAEWLECRLGTWRWRVSIWIRGVGSSAVTSGHETAVYRPGC